MPPKDVLPASLRLNAANYPADNETKAQHNTRCAAAFRKMYKQTQRIDSREDGFAPSKTRRFVVTPDEDNDEDDDEDGQWTGCNFQCNKCVANKNKGAGGACTNTVCIGGPVCWQHSLQFFHVRGAQTELKSGNQRLNFHGLFACNTKEGPNAVVFRGPSARNAHDGDLILPYIAEKITEDVMDHRYGAGNHTVAPYGISIKKSRGAVGRLEDAACRRTMMSLANTKVNRANYSNTHARNVQPNAEFDTITVAGNNTHNKGYLAVLRATRNIENGDEIIVKPGSYPLPPRPEKFVNKGARPSATACRMRA